MIMSIIGFVALSCVCGVVGTLDAMVAARFLQGLFAAPLIPLSQATIVDAYPVAERSRGLSIWAMGVILGPALGPALGGLLTQHIHWRMCFFVNVPIGAVALLLCVYFVRPTERLKIRIDWTGLMLAAALVVPLQIALDQGDEQDWLSSKLIVMLFAVAALAGAAFVVRGLIVKNNILPLRLFADRNFALSTLAIACLGIVLFAQTTLSPVMLEDLLGWQVDTAGLVMGVFGIGGFIGATISPYLVRWIGSRASIVLGAFVVVLGQFLGLGLNLDMSPWQAPIPGFFAVLGIMIAYVPTTGLAFANVPIVERDDAAAEYNFVKTIGFVKTIELSIGVSLVSTLLYGRPQFHTNVLISHVRVDNEALRQFVHALGADEWNARVATVVAKTVGAQATMLAVLDVFFVMIGVAAIVAVLAALTRRAR